MSLDTVLAIASFALAVGQVVVLVVTRAEHTKRFSLAVGLTLLVVTTGALAFELVRSGRLVRQTAERIVMTIGNNRLTLDELHELLLPADQPRAGPALDRLLEAGRIGQVILELQEPNGLTHRTRAYYVQAFN